MSFVLGRDAAPADGPICRLGAYRALDGSDGAAIHLDLDSPHAVLLVGKRGYGKSYTMGVIAEGLARSRGVAPVIVDPMGAFDTLSQPATGDAVPARVIDDPAVAPDSLDPRSWCTLLGLSPESGAGGLLWQAAQAESTIDGMRTHLESADASSAATRAAENHLRLAESWGVFDADGLAAADLATAEVTVVDVSGLADAPMNAVCRGIAETLYRARIRRSIDRLPWLLLDEAHTFFDGVAEPALETILTRGRAPGVSLVAATQRPSAVPEVGISQSDILVSHRLTARADLAALESAQPTYMNGSLADADRLPESPGDVVVIDDATETVHAARIRARDTPHGGDSPSASDSASGGG
ncbi:ATP-binding protein [Natrinema versiforme]|uniref:ATP-binding protein n=1 Tax=Natrinema versiforme TaxID=88724 RepID=A0A4P8WFX8_9EURY|nr:DUF87 domain-containing protein [Natrinema versiforme]QCS41965.1 ATP-binding protein [Natrinema versiforme]